MVYQDDESIKIDDTLLPGLVKSIEIKNEAQVDEQEVEGQSKKPKQATGYEDAKINIELILEDTQDETGKVTVTRRQKLEQLQALFRRQGQEKPEVHRIVCEDAAARGLSQVLLKNLTHKAENKKQQVAVTLELWEYLPITITASKSGSTSSAKEKASASSGGLSEDYKSYLGEERGKPPSKEETAKAALKVKQSPTYQAAAAVTTTALTALTGIPLLPF